MDKPVYCPKCAHQFAHDYAPAMVPNVPYSYVTFAASVVAGDERVTSWVAVCGWCGYTGEIREVAEL
jgi:hypothetical protein